MNLRTLARVPTLHRTVRETRRAFQRQDWSGAEEGARRLLALRLESSLVRYWLGTALLHQERVEEALLEFESIRRRLWRPRDEAKKTINHTIALVRARRIQEAGDVVRSADTARWPEPLARRAESILAELSPHLKDH